MVNLHHPTLQPALEKLLKDKEQLMRRVPSSGYNEPDLATLQELVDVSEVGTAVRTDRSSVALLSALTLTKVSLSYSSGGH